MRNSKSFLAAIIGILTIVWFGAAYAAASSGSSVGQVTQNAADIVGVFTNVFYDVCYVIGGTLLVGSGLQYKTYRTNPSQAPLSRVMTLLIIGIALMLLPLISQMSPAAAAVS